MSLGKLKDKLKGYGRITRQNLEFGYTMSEGPTLQSGITQKWLELSLGFFHITKIWVISGHLQLV